MRHTDAVTSQQLDRSQAIYNAGRLRQTAAKRERERQSVLSTVIQTKTDESLYTFLRPQAFLQIFPKSNSFAFMLNNSLQTLFSFQENLLVEILKV